MTTGSAFQELYMNTTMPNDASYRVTPQSLCEDFITNKRVFVRRGGEERRLGSVVWECGAVKIKILRNTNLVVEHHDLHRSTFTRHRLADDRVLVLKTKDTTSFCEEEIRRYCEDSPKVAGVFESPIVHELPGATLRDVITRHFHRLTEGRWHLSRETDLKHAKIIMFALRHMPADMDIAEHIKNADFNFENIEMLREDVRAFQAQRELLK